MYTYTQGHSTIVGTGVYLPEERITTRALMREIDSKGRFGVSEDWLERVTGIREKRVTPPGVLPSDMAVKAAAEALDRTRTSARQIDALIYTGVCRDYLEPATAHIVQAKLGATNAVVFDISNACHGFMNGIHVMDSLISTGQVHHGLVVTGEQGSLFTRRSIEALGKTMERTEFNSWAAAMTVGDAGAAIVMGPKRSPEGGLMAVMLQSQGQHANLCTAGDHLTKGEWHADMPRIVAEGASLIKKMFHEFMFQRLKWQIQELAKCLIHQIGARGLIPAHTLVGVPTAIIPKTVDRLGNLITANIPVALHQCMINQELKSGDKVYLSGIGSGISLSQAGLVWDGL